MTKPINPAEFAQLPDDHLLKCTQFVTRPGQPGPFPFSRTFWWQMVKEGQFAPGRKLPGREGPVHPRYWTVAEVKAAIADVMGEVA